MSTLPEDGLCRTTSCRIPLRKSQQLLADKPGTRVHAGEGLCYTCWRKRGSITQARVAQLQAELQRYLHSRGKVGTR